VPIDLARLFVGPPQPEDPVIQFYRLAVFILVASTIATGYDPVAARQDYGLANYALGKWGWDRSGSSACVASCSWCC
jgi:hypothetical protein